MAVRTLSHKLYMGKASPEKVKTISISNKTKYFRLRLSDEVGTERPETDLRQTYERKMKIQCFRAIGAPLKSRWGLRLGLVKYK